MITIIAAAAENNALGKDNDLVWHLPDDFKRFKVLTSGHSIIMGRKTFESLPKTLPNRTHIIITRSQDYKAVGNCIIVHSLKTALQAAQNDDQPFIIGGGEIYKQSMDIADKIKLTRVHTQVEADFYFPEINPEQWELISQEYHPEDERHKYAFTYLTYIRKKKA